VIYKRGARGSLERAELDSGDLVCIMVNISGLLASTTTYRKNIFTLLKVISRPL
jgi:hypothetical protein